MSDTISSDRSDADDPELIDEDGSSSSTKAQKSRSTIRFPYTDIDDAVTVASKIKQVHGNGQMPVDQLAVALGGTSTKSGAFRTKLATAATFGAIKNGRRFVELTELGHRLADEPTRPAAMVEAFLRVPLYEAIYEAYQEKHLPADRGLESDIREFGVVENQAARARQAMQRSAEKAGFFWGGRTRLVIPPNATIGVTGTPDASRNVGGDAVGATQKNTGGEDKMSEAPLLKALWDTLPADKDFSTEQRKRFFTALAFNIDYVYGPPSDGGTLDPQGVAALWAKPADG